MTDVLVPRALVRDAARFGGHADGDCLRGRPVWKNGKLVSLAPPACETLTGILLPALVEVHCHLDKGHTLHRLGPVGGNLAQAIALQARDKRHWSADDIARRAMTGLSELRMAGCNHIRTHIDWGEDRALPLTWRVIRDLNEPGLQLAALTGIDQMAEKGFAQDVARQVAADKGVLGSFVLHQDARAIRQGLQNMFAAAQAHDLMLDFHVDEDLDMSNGLESIADAALACEFERPVLCGHACTLTNRSEADFHRIADKLARANITICALPTTNLYLQGRNGGTPDRRGITRLKELRAAGVRVVVGSDNASDAFCPLGRNDPRHALYLAALAAHLDPPFDQWLTMITTDAQASLGVGVTHVDGADAQDLRICKVPSTAHLIQAQASFEKVVP